MKLNDLKRKHNSLMDKARRLYDRTHKIVNEINQIRERVRLIEGDDYDPIPLIFGDGFNVLEEDEDREE